ncbi:protein RRP6-like 3 isoform X2 [Typha latifolia]|uniref:protein RRP6-like 3 isoform X2 n=1 Tax=Typha latifolia TaxID=4733 RepID=UPI003C2BE990
MARCEKIHAIFAITCVAAVVSIIASAALLRRRRREAAGRRRRCYEPAEKPQHRFKRVLADNSYSPFKHFKREGKEKGVSLKMHPYEEEITSLLDNPVAFSNFVLNHEYSDISTSYTWINTEPQLEFLATLLSGEQVFAVDTEQHSLRSFLGYTALMQISTQKEDFLIDTIALHDVMGILRPVFADPSICKVFHGADNDVLWLQRDFHIYVVNMFDTAKACVVLSKPQKSLAYLLETYCGVSTDKTLQREDWRIRPLSSEMIEYALCDAHYLLYIADCLASELCMKTCASRRSNMVCMQLYMKEIESTPGASAATSILSRNLQVQGFDSSRICELKDLVWKLCAWRDLMARIHDESLRYVLSDQAIAALAVKVPTSSTEIYNVIVEADLSNGSSKIYPSPPLSPVIVSHVEELSCLLQDMTVSLDDVFKSSVDKFLDPDGCCPLSIYNYALMSQFNLANISMISLKQSGERLMTTGGKKASRELFVRKFSCKSPVYHNCRIYANDGRLLCYCDRKKLEWYLRRHLAKVVEDNPPAIMLLFEPKGRPEDEGNEFYIQSKKNICVGCGEKNHYIRYRIIPSCYRMHFPEHLKSHRSHDIVLLCVDCHETAHSAAEKYKKEIANEFGIPLFVQKIVDSGDKTIVTIGSRSENKTNESGVSPLHLRTAAMALLRHGSSMPSDRQEELMQTVKAYYGGREVTQEHLKMALLVGMSPHERRRLEKKKGLTFQKKELIFTGNHSTCTIQETIKYELEKNHAIPQELSEGDINECDGGHWDKSTSNKDTTFQCNDSSTFGSNIGSFDCNKLHEQGKNSSSNNGIMEENMHRTFDSSVTHQVISSERGKKLSLLGHGPHGKQVVEHLFDNYGEEGICQFCQRWREVFVEAINPRFLPTGWNIKHRVKLPLFGWLLLNVGLSSTVKALKSQVHALVHQQVMFHWPRLDCLTNWSVQVMNNINIRTNRS